MTQAKAELNVVGTMAIAQLIRRIGGPVIVGRICGVTRQAVIQWHKVPADKVLKLARESPVPITPHEIRRDLYPHPLDGTRPPARKRTKANGSKPAP